VRIPETNMHEALGVEMAEAGDGVVTGKLPVTDKVRQPFGLVHGGALLTLAESLTSFGTWVGVRDQGQVALGQEINASLMRPITEGHVHGTARVRRRGRTAWVWEVEITDDADRLCALIRATIAVRDAPA
jgi:1,4-dihydroxy-2-naphthoyl-CoA hydrolase